MRKIVETPVIFLEGEANAIAVPAIKNEADELLSTGEKNLIIDVSKACYVDGNCLNLLESIYQKCTENGGNMTIVCTDNPRVRQVFELTRLDEKIGVHASIKNARVVVETIGR